MHVFIPGYIFFKNTEKKYFWGKVEIRKKENGLRKQKEGKRKIRKWNTSLFVFQG